MKAVTVQGQQTDDSPALWGGVRAMLNILFFPHMGVVLGMLSKNLILRAFFEHELRCCHDHAIDDSRLLTLEARANHACFPPSAQILMITEKVRENVIHVDKYKPGEDWMEALIRVMLDRL